MERIRINSATSNQIADLYDIGPQLAERIVQYRNAQGYFYAPDDLAKVKGISLELAFTLAPHINWELPTDVSKKRDYISFLGFFIAFLGSIYLIYYRRIPDVLIRIERYYQGEHGGFIWVLIQVCLLLTTLIAGSICLTWALSSITKSKKIEKSLAKIASMLVITGVLVVILLVLLNGIFYQFFSPDGWRSFFVNKVNLTSAMVALALGLITGIFLLFLWKPHLLSNDLLRRTIDITLLLLGMGMVLTVWSGQGIFPIWLLLALLVVGILTVTFGWLGMRKGNFFTDALIDIYLAEFLKEAAESSENWQAWINARLPNPDDQQALRDTLIKTYPPSKVQSVFSILFVGIGSWLIITVLASIIDWFIQHSLNSLWAWPVP